MTNVEFFDLHLYALKQKHKLSDECIDDVRQLCISHAINCSMDATLLEYSSKWLVNKIVDSLEGTPALSSLAAEFESTPSTTV